MISEKNLNYNQNIKTLFLIGNGAIEGGSAPLIECLKQAKEDGYFLHNVDLVSGISSLSMLVATQKMIFDQLILRIRGNLDASSKSILECINSLYAFIILRHNLAGEYEKSSTLTLRSSVVPFLDMYGISEGSSFCITTNWDEVLYNRQGVQNQVIQLHGRCSVPSSLILPTETIIERALQSVLLKECEGRLKERGKNERIHPKFIDAIIKHYCIDEQAWLFSEENKFMSHLKRVDRLVIIGLEFNDYDHELMSTISMFKNKQLGQVVIINTILKIDLKYIQSSKSEAAHSDDFKKAMKKAREERVEKIQGLLEVEREKIVFFDTNPMHAWLNDKNTALQCLVESSSIRCYETSL